MELNLRRMLTIVDDRFEEAGRKAGTRLRKVAVVAIVQNPYVGRYVSDLRPLIEASESLGSTMARESASALEDYAAESYGKGGIVGLQGEQEHANALLTTVFAAPFRDAIGGAKSWISSMTKVAAPGVLIDIPMNSKDDVYVRSHYDGMSIMLPDAPKPGEIAIIFCLANRGRLNARLGGLPIEKARGQAAQV
jgi:Amino acid synthesis